MTLAELEALERDHAVPTYARNPVEFVRGSGCRLWDADGNEYLDFLAGISVLNVGHCHPHVVHAVGGKGGLLPHLSNLRSNKPGLQRVGEPCSGYERPGRQASSKRLGGGQRVGDDAGLLIGPQR
ncbi:MAG: aminotransferase class III-fold pyridoxal phosphate-dependent enzyme, partial [Solirubrobacteraceae bacterium]